MQEAKLEETRGALRDKEAQVKEAMKTVQQVCSSRSSSSSSRCERAAGGVRESVRPCVREVTRRGVSESCDAAPMLGNRCRT